MTVCVLSEPTTTRITASWTSAATSSGGNNSTSSPGHHHAHEETIIYDTVNAAGLDDEFDAPPPPPPPLPGALMGRSPSVRRCVAVYPYEGAGLEESNIPMAEGEEFELVEADSDGWTRVRRADGSGEEGYVPTSFIRVM